MKRLHDQVQLPLIPNHLVCSLSNVSYRINDVIFGKLCNNSLNHIKGFFFLSLRRTGSLTFTIVLEVLIYLKSDESTSLRLVPTELDKLRTNKLETKSLGFFVSIDINDCS